MYEIHTFKLTITPSISSSLTHEYNPCLRQNSETNIFLLVTGKSGVLQFESTTDENVCVDLFW